jgi:hypothetical protein
MFDPNVHAIALELLAARVNGWVGLVLQESQEPIISQLRQTLNDLCAVLKSSEDSLISYCFWSDDITTVPVKYRLDAILPIVIFSTAPDFNDVRDYQSSKGNGYPLPPVTLFQLSPEFTLQKVAV